jgi:hypothetical protein
MNEQAGDLLATVLNIDAEIRIRTNRLTEMERTAQGRMEPWLDEAQTVLRADVARLRARREEQLRKLEALLAGRPTGDLGGKHAPFGWLKRAGSPLVKVRLPLTTRVQHHKHVEPLALPSHSFVQ